MKKTLLLLILLFIVVQLGFTYNKEIKYQDIEWGTSAPQVAELLKTLGFNNTSASIDNTNTYKIIGTRETKTIAGHQIRKWTASFYPTGIALLYDNNGWIDKSFYKFYQMSFEFSLNASTRNSATTIADAIYNDLQSKLNSIYGKQTGSSFANPITRATIKETNWYGLNDSSITLRLNYKGDNGVSPLVTLTYSGNKKEKENAEKQQKDRETTFDSTNTSGL